jgi:hypothetical protein
MVRDHVALALTGYAVVGLLVCEGLAWRWRGVDNGVRPSVVGLLWPVTLFLVALYYGAACLYTILVVQRGRSLS